MNEADDKSARLEDALERWGDAVYRLALCRTGNSHDAEDVAQSVFLGFYEQFGNVNDPEHAKAWLLRSTMNRCKNLQNSSWARKVTRMPMDEMTKLHEEAEGSEDLAVSSESTQISRALYSLPDKQRTAIHLYYGEGYKTDEIAAMTDERPSTVRSHLRRAREKLRKTLGDEYDWT